MFIWMSAARLSATNPSIAHSASCGSTRCSNITGRLVADANYICPGDHGESRPIDGRPVTQVNVDGTKPEVEATCWYLGDRVCDNAIAARCGVAWGKFRKLLPVLTPTHLTHRVHGKVCRARANLAMIHGSKTWGLNTYDLDPPHWPHHDLLDLWLQRPRWNNLSPLLQKIGIKGIMRVLHSGRQKWYRHVQCVSSCTKSVTDLPFP